MTYKLLFTFLHKHKPVIHHLFNNLMDEKQTFKTRRLCAQILLLICLKLFEPKLQKYFITFIDTYKNKIFKFCSILYPQWIESRLGFTNYIFNGFIYVLKYIFTLDTNVSNKHSF